MFGVRKVAHVSQTSPPFWRFNPAENMAYASVYHLSSTYLPAYLDFLRSYRPSVIMGYPSALYTIARYAVDHDDYPTPAKGIFTTSETVTEVQRECIEEAWQTKIFDRYGAVEGCLFASQCEFGRYHVSPEAGIIEILDAHGRPCPPGVLGEVVCTGLQNRLQPLVRYQIGDVARWSENQQCPCGRQMPILEAIDGRIEDLCYTKDGREIVRFDTVFKGVETIKEAQVVQERRDLFLIYIVSAPGFSEQDSRRILSNMHLHVGTVDTQIVLVSQIARTPSGKFKAVVCKLSSDEKRVLQQGVTAV
jgi:phenylacetate-CoA ligase